MGFNCCYPAPFGRGDCVLCWWSGLTLCLKSCCSGWSGSEYPWNGNNSSERKGFISNDLSFQITDPPILERNVSFVGSQTAVLAVGYRRMPISDDMVRGLGGPRSLMGPIDQLAPASITSPYEILGARAAGHGAELPMDAGLAHLSDPLLRGICAWCFTQK